MKSKLLILPGILLLLTAAVHVCGAQIDPILLNKPNPLVAECNDDFFLQVSGKATTSATLGKHSAKPGQLFLILVVRSLFLLDDVWDDGFDTSSFTVTHNGTGGEWTGSLESAVTKDLLVQKDYDLVSDTLLSPSYKTYRLVFSIPNTITDKGNWTLHFNPTQYLEDEEVDDWDFDADVSSGGSAEPLCGTSIAFTVQ